MVHIKCVFVGCTFAAISTSDCPCTKLDLKGCSTLPECDSNMNENELCEAGKTLPDGNGDFDVNNCPNHYDVFQCQKGTKIILWSKFFEILIKFYSINIYIKLK